MRLTSTLHAAGAALGLLVGLTMNHPEDSAPLASEVAPYALTVAWHSPAPGPEMPVAGVQADDWGGRMPQPAVRPSRERARTPAVRRVPHAPRAPRAPSAKPGREMASAPAALAVKLAMLESAVLREECPRDRLARLAVQAARAAAARES